MRHFLSLSSFDENALAAFVMRSLSIKKAFQHGDKIPCPQVPVANLFFEASTRTRTSFELAERRLGLPSTSLAVQSSSVSKGETLRDTVMNLYSMGIKAFVVRHSSSGAVEFLSKRCPEVHFVNAGDGSHEHPTQGLLDLVTLWEQWGGVKGKTIAIIGDLRHSRVARSNLHALPKLGATVNLFGPPTLVPRQLQMHEKVKICADFGEAVSKADAVMVLRIQRERMTQGFLPSLADYSRGFGLTKQRAELLRPDAVILHPGPINRGVEIDDAVADSDRSVILRQVENGVFARMAVLQWLLEEVRK